MYLSEQPRKTAAFRTETIRGFGVFRFSSVGGCCFIGFLLILWKFQETTQRVGKKNYGETVCA
jgi:hypothetical protein